MRLSQLTSVFIFLISHFTTVISGPLMIFNILQTSATALNFSKRAFCHASPTVWNSLPQSVISDLTVTPSTFRNRFKSALYGCASESDVQLKHKVKIEKYTTSKMHTGGTDVS